MNTSVIIVTLNRPDCVRRCLGCLFAQVPRPEQIIVVDASPGDETREVTAEFGGVLYLRNNNGYGRMTASRNIGLKRATGDIIAFLDDDAFAHPGWLENLLRTYAEPNVGAVGGRALNNQPGEDTAGVHEIGQLKPNGLLTGNFAADPGKIIEVDHIIGCNMSYRRSVLAALGGLRPDYTGTEVREETDICLRVKSLGYKILFNPAACVDHIGAPQVKGQRFDARYAYYGQRNHIVLLLRNFGPGAGVLWRYFGYSLWHYGLFEFFKRLGAACVRLALIIFGSFQGIFSGVTIFVKLGCEAVRHDTEGKKITQCLQDTSTEQAEDIVTV